MTAKYLGRKLEASMQDYEIRILKVDGGPSVMTHNRYFSSNAAIAAVRRMAGNCNFEVWCGDYCIYASENAPAPTTRPPDQPAA